MSLSLKTYARIYELKQKSAKGRTFAENQELKKLNLKLQAEKLENELMEGERDILYTIACAVVANPENGKQYEKFVKNAIEKYSAISKKFSADGLMSIFDEDVKNIRQGYEKKKNQKQNNQK